VLAEVYSARFGLDPDLRKQKALLEHWLGVWSCGQFVRKWTSGVERVL
jgi:hypothetical protein